MLDFGLKKGMNRGMFANANLAYGTKDRYSERFMGAAFKDKIRVMGFGSFNNTNIWDLTAAEAVRGDAARTD